MHSIDVTRQIFDAGKRYSGMLHTQGSVLLDSDQNEGALIQQDGERRLLTDLLVTSGSPDDGMKIGAITPTPAGYDFAIGAGVYFLGGLRLDTPVAERFRLQTEYLQMRDTAALPASLPNEWLTDVQDAVPSTPPAAPRTDLVWLEAWEQAVTGVEDRALIETALGVDASARLRPMRKVHVFTGGATDCSSGFAALVASLQAAGKVTYDPDSAELRSNRRIVVDFVDVGPDPDPCTPPVRRGFLGAENETIQVRIISDTRFAWSFGNAAPLYRVTLTGNALDFVTPPRDALLRPLAGDVIELVRCDAILPNGELIGERHGLFYRVLTSYDPVTGVVGLENGPATTDFFNDTARAATLAAAFGADAPDGHLYARVWRGETIAAAPLGKTIGAAPGVQLGNTGVTVAFTGNGPVGDSWTFSVRPNTPDVIAPWEMREGAPPTAPRRYITGLGLIQWSGVAGAVPVFTDCRRRVRKLANASGCCEVTVGDNQESFGDVSSVAAALARLPASGGKICLLRGTHRENIVIKDRENIVIEGCGALTRLVPPAGSLLPMVAIIDSEAITVRGFRIDARAAIGVAIDDKGTGDFGERVQNIRLEKLIIASRDAPAILFNGGEGLSVEHCRIDLEPIGQRPTTPGAVNGLTSSILLFGRDMRVERCAIEGLRHSDRMQIPLGGIHVIGGSEDVEIRRNRIAATGGTGIVLGSVSMVPEGMTPDERDPKTRLPFAAELPWPTYAGGGGGVIIGIVIIWIYLIGPDGCITIVTVPVGTPGGNGPTLVPDADPFIIGCGIIDNDIEDMGECGIGPFAQFDLSKDRQLCGVADLLIRENRIRNCVRGEPPVLVDGQYVYTARGGIVLGWAEQVDILDNVIEGCGTNRSDPVCGIFAAGLSHARISRNRIHDNGRRIVEFAGLPPMGQRGGIVIRGVVPGVLPLSSIFPTATVGTNTAAATPAFSLQSGRDALVVHGNQVSTPEGRALEVNGTGGMAIGDNQFTSLGAVAASAFWTALFMQALGVSTAGGANPGLAGLTSLFKLDPFATLMGNAVISVINLGLSTDFTKLTVGFGFGSNTSDEGDVDRITILTTGRVLFDDNQTRFDGIALPLTIVPALVGLVSLDDVKMADNQCDADFTPQIADIVISHAVVLAISGQMANNRISEPDSFSFRGAFPQFSGACFGLSILMHHNFGSHCFIASATQKYSILGPNRTIVDANICEEQQKRFGLVGERFLFAADDAGIGKPEDTDLNDRYAIGANLR